MSHEIKRWNKDEDTVFPIKKKEKKRKRREKICRQNQCEDLMVTQGNLNVKIKQNSMRYTHLLCLTCSRFGDLPTLFEANANFSS